MKRIKILLTQNIFGATYRQAFKTVVVRANDSDVACSLALSENAGWNVCEVISIKNY